MLLPPRRRDPNRCSYRAQKGDGSHQRVGAAEVLLGKGEGGGRRALRTQARRHRESGAPALLAGTRSSVKEPARASCEEEDSETPDEDTFSRPEPKQVIKLSAEPRGSGGRVLWRGRLRGGGSDVYLTGSWVRKNFKVYGQLRRTFADASHPLSLMLALRFFRYFLASVQAAGGSFVHVKTGNARPEAAPAGTGGHWDGPWPRQLPLPVLSAHGTSASALVIPTAERPVVAYRQDAADFCAAYGIASAVHAFGDASGAAAVAACAHAALASDDAFGHVTICIVRPRSSNVARITCRP